MAIAVAPILGRAVITCAFSLRASNVIFVLSLFADWPLRAETTAPRLPFLLGQLWRKTQTARTYAYKCLLLAWRLLRDMAFEQSTPIGIPKSPALLAAPARCWDMWALSRFDHAIFPKTTSPLETVFYLLRIKLLGGTTLFIVRDQKQHNRLIASLYIRQLPGSTVGFISNVGVHPNYRRKKLAKWMMQSLALPLARDMRLSKLVLNVREPFVESFYERQGFRRYFGNAFEIATPADESPMFMMLTASSDDRDRSTTVDPPIRSVAL